MRRKTAGIPVLLLAIATLSGCQAFFTTSLGSSLARDTITVPADISNAEAAAILAGEPSDAMLESLLAVLNDQAAAGDTGAATLAAEAAVQASDVSTTLMDAVATAMTGGTIDIVSIVTDLQASATAEVLQGLTGLGDDVTGDIVTSVLIDPETGKAKLGPTELAVASLILAASALPTGVTNPAAMDAGQLAAFQADPAVKLASNLLAQAATDGGDVTLLDYFNDYLP